MGGVLLGSAPHCRESGTVGAHCVSTLERTAGAFAAWGRPCVCLLVPVDRVEGGCILCRQMGPTGPYRGVGGAQVDPEGRAPGILQLGVRHWGLPGLSLPALCPARPWTLCTGGLVQQPLRPGWAWAGAPGDTRPVSRSEQGAGVREPRSSRGLGSAGWGVGASEHTAAAEPVYALTGCAA